MQRFAILTIGLLLGLVGGFFVGSRVGTYEHALADAQYKASVLAYELRALKAGKSEPIVTTKEISLNGELANHGRYMESNFGWLWPQLRSSDESPIRRAVAYRLENPYRMPDLASSANWNPGIDMNSDFVKEAIQGQHEMDQHVQRVLRHYAPASTPAGASNADRRP